jgi:hypothetical protein
MDAYHKGLTHIDSLDILDASIIQKTGKKWKPLAVACILNGININAIQGLVVIHLDANSRRKDAPKCGLLGFLQVMIENDINLEGGDNEHPDSHHCRKEELRIIRIHGKLTEIFCSYRNLTQKRGWSEFHHRPRPWKKGTS